MPVRRTGPDRVAEDGAGRSPQGRGLCHGGGRRARDLRSGGLVRVHGPEFVRHSGRPGPQAGVDRHAQPRPCLGRGFRPRGSRPALPRLSARAALRQGRGREHGLRLPVPAGDGRRLRKSPGIHARERQHLVLSGQPLLPEAARTRYGVLGKGRRAPSRLRHDPA